MIYRIIILDDESYIADSTAVFLRSDCPWEMELQVFMIRRRRWSRCATSGRIF